MYQQFINREAELSFVNDRLSAKPQLLIIYGPVKSWKDPDDCSIHQSTDLIYRPSISW